MENVTGGSPSEVLNGKYSCIRKTELASHGKNECSYRLEGVLHKTYL